MRLSARRIEGRLLVFAALVLLSGFLLVFLAKLPKMYKHESININTASAEEIATHLKVETEQTEPIIQYRKKHGPFQGTSGLQYVRLLEPDQAKKLSGKDISQLSPDDISQVSGVSIQIAKELLKRDIGKDGSKASEKKLLRLSAISNETLKNAEMQLRVRDPQSVIIQFWIYSILIIIGFIIYHIILKKSVPNSDPYILTCIMMLAGIGLILMFSIKDPLRDTFIFTKQAHGILLGLLVACIPLTSWYKNLRPWRYTYIYALLSVFITLLLAIFGTGPGGAKLRIFGLQPVEIVKILLAYFVAGYLADRWIVLTDKSASTGKGFKIPLFHDIAPLLVMYFISLGTFILVRDLGPMLILFGMFAAMLYVSTEKSAFILIGLIIVSISGFLSYILHLGVFDVRVDMWLSPWNNSHPNGMQLGEALWGFGSGGIWGSGLGLGQPNLMPRSGSDLVFASLGEELGLIGSIFVIILFAIIIVRGFRTAIKSQSSFQRLIVLSVTILLGLQTIIIIFGVLGLIPLTGVSLPFMSYGKSSLTASFFMAGLILSTSSASPAHSKMDKSISITTHTIRKLGTGMLILLLGVAGIGRLVIIQGVKADQTAGKLIVTPDADGYTRSHINPRLKYIAASIPRGSIYDRNGEPLATSRASEMPVSADSNKKVNRYYPLENAAVHIVGYINPSYGGPVGMEKTFNHYLRGFDDYSKLLPLYRYSYTPFKPKIIGKDIQLTIDSKLQMAVKESLTKHTSSIRNKATGKRKTKAAAVVIDVRTGEILASVSLPDYNANTLTKTSWKSYNSNKEEAVLLNRVSNGYYPPGSVFKLITASAALKNNEDFLYRCNHKELNVTWRSKGKTYSRRQITDLEEMRPHGITDLSKAIRVSCNVYFAKLGLKLGSKKLHDIMLDYGFSKTPSSAKLIADLPDNSYGQGIIQVTPMEMARAAAAIANGGVMLKPHLLKEVSIEGKTLEETAPVEIGQPISSEDAAKLRSMMADAAANGTGKGLFSGLNVSAAGKTGSAENEHADKMPHSWFVGFAPADEPKIAFAVIVENGGYGRNAAGPVCRDIIKAAFK